MTDDRKAILEKAYRHQFPGRIDTFAASGISIIMGRREGYRFWDLDGREFMDFHINGGVYNLGHRNPELIRVLREALDHHDIGNHHFASVPSVALAEKLVKLSPLGMCRYVVFTTGASEANDVAVKSARYATGRRRIVAPDIAYHGRTIMTGAIGDDSAARFFHSDYPDECVKVRYNDLDAMEAALKRKDVAAVLMETIPACLGFPQLDPGYLPGVKALCERYGTLYVADEVQTGFGRSGKLWGIENWNVAPDIMVIGKGTSGGLYPIAATLLSEQAGGWLKANGFGHVSTFGGSELGTIVSRRVLEICSDPKTLAHVKKIADYMVAGFRDIQQRHPYLLEIWSTGLVMGLRFDNRNGAVHMQKALYENGVWTIYSPYDSSALQWNPGLLIDNAYCDEALQKFETALRAAEKLPDDREPTSFLRVSAR